MSDFFLRPKRRDILASMMFGLLTHSRSSSAQETDPNLENLKLVDLTEAGRRFVLLTPRHLDAGQKLPLVVLLHGLGETSNEKEGAYAWFAKYGLGSAWNRLKRAPVEPKSRRGEWTAPRLREVNEELAVRPFRGFAMACPYMPKPAGRTDLGAYAQWIGDCLVPRVRRETPVLETSDRTYLCGVSLGGYVALEVLVRRPQMFGAWAGVQTAIIGSSDPRIRTDVDSIAC